MSFVAAVRMEILISHQHKGVHHGWALFCGPCGEGFETTGEAMDVRSSPRDVDGQPKLTLISTTAASMALVTSLLNGSRSLWMPWALMPTRIVSFRARGAASITALARD